MQSLDQGVHDVGQLSECRRTVVHPRGSLTEGQAGNLEGHHQLGFGAVPDRGEEIGRVLVADDVEQLVEVEWVVPGEGRAHTTVRREAADPVEHLVGQDTSRFWPGCLPIERPPSAAARSDRSSGFGDAPVEERTAALEVVDLLCLGGESEHDAKRGF